LLRCHIGTCSPLSQEVPLCRYHQIGGGIMGLPFATEARGFLWANSGLDQSDVYEGTTAPSYPVDMRAGRHYATFTFRSRCPGEDGNGPGSMLGIAGTDFAPTGSSSLGFLSRVASAALSALAHITPYAIADGRRFFIRVLPLGADKRPESHLGSGGSRTLSSQIPNSSTFMNQPYPLRALRTRKWGV
jgi:hypothetical protein